MNYLNDTIHIVLLPSRTGTPRVNDVKNPELGTTELRLPGGLDPLFSASRALHKLGSFHLRQSRLLREITVF